MVIEPHFSIVLLFDILIQSNSDLVWTGLCFLPMTPQAYYKNKVDEDLLTMKRMRLLFSKIFIKVLVSYSEGFLRVTPSGRP